MPKPMVSIMMRSMNDSRYIERTLSAIMTQTFRDFELVNVDSGSTDGTYEIVRKYNPTKSKQILPSEYVPGKVLNAAVRECAGEIVVFNNSDCIPLDSKWLENLIAPFHSDSQVAATFANQVPRPDARPLVAKDNIRAFGDGSVSAKWKHFFSLASSATRKEIVMQQPFDEKIKYSEDVEWSRRIKGHGWKIAYAPAARVEHSHNYTLREVMKRFYNEGLAEGRIYGSCPSFIRGFAIPLLAESSRDFIYLAKKGLVADMPYGAVYRMLQRYYAYRGRKNYLEQT
jgi:rhamnosyltransferase